jgi:hypothetical protein
MEGELSQQTLTASRRNSLVTCLIGLKDAFPPAAFGCRSDGFHARQRIGNQIDALMILARADFVDMQVQMFPPPPSGKKTKFKSLGKEAPIDLPWQDEYAAPNTQLVSTRWHARRFDPHFSPCPRTNLGTGTSRRTGVECSAISPIPPWRANQSHCRLRAASS